MNRPHSLPAAALLLAAAALVLGACGQVGRLDQPPPMWGAKAKADYRTRKAAETAKAKGDKDDGEAEPLAPDTPGLDTPPGGPPTIRADPGPGMMTSPNPAAPPGVLPDPSSGPQ